MQQYRAENRPRKQTIAGRSFLGENAFGIGAAIASFLMVLFVPFLIYQVRSQRRNN